MEGDGAFRFNEISGPHSNTISNENQVFRAQVSYFSSKRLEN